MRYATIADALAPGPSTPPSAVAAWQVAMTRRQAREIDRLDSLAEYYRAGLAAHGGGRRPSWRRRLKAKIEEKSQR